MKIKKIFLMLAIVVLSAKINCFAEINNISMVTIDVWDSSGELRTPQELPDVSVEDCFLKDSDIEISLDETYVAAKYNAEKSTMDDLDEDIKSMIFGNMSDEEFVSVITLRSTDEENPYPEIQPIKIRYYMSESVGVWSEQSDRLGKDYRLYHLKNGLMREMTLIDCDEISAKFVADALGYYVFYYNPHVYTFEFYGEYPEGYPENENTAIHIAENLKRFDEVTFPVISEKEGCIFTGWKQEIRRGFYRSFLYVDQAPMEAYMNSYVYASWCPEDEYTPLEIVLDSEKITKGKEDGCEMTLELSEGKFDETIDENIEDDWKIVGSDELSISSVERIDDTTVKIILAGNSSDKYKTSEIQIEFNSELYISHEGFGDNWEVHEIADIQLDETGIKKKWFISDNSITFEKQKKSGNGGGVTKHIIEFETNGGEAIQSVRIANGHTLEEPERVLKEGYVFVGWYTDEQLTNLYNFEESVTDDFTLYAAWEKYVPQTIILTVGEKEAIVFGKEVKNDVAPLLENGSVMLPIRFVAEALGAKVEWNIANPQEVKITKGEQEIVSFIGKENVLINGEPVKLDTPAFMENDRTYLPVRFVAENLGCTVDWEQETKQIIITP